MKNMLLIFGVMFIAWGVDCHDCFILSLLFIVTGSVMLSAYDDRELK